MQPTALITAVEIGVLQRPNFISWISGKLLFEDEQPLTFGEFLEGLLDDQEGPDEVGFGGDSLNEKLFPPELVLGIDLWSGG